MFTAKCHRFDTILLQPLQFMGAVYHLRVDLAVARTFRQEVPPLRR